MICVKTYLITGGAGFIGSNFIQYILNQHYSVKIINLDLLTYAGNLENLRSVKNHPNYKFIHGDIGDKKILSDIFNQHDVDYIINFAAESHVDRSILEPEIFARTNILGSVNLLNAAKNSWETKNGFKNSKKYIQISTDEVYGSLGETGYFTEATPLNPHSPYSASKASADMLVKAYFDTFGMPINITRCSNNYGPFQFPEKLIPLIILNCITHKPIPIYGDGMNIRDWIYVEDHCRGIDMVAANGSNGEVYNIGGNNEKANIEIVKLIIEYIRNNYDSSVGENLITYVSDRKGHDKRYAIDASKINEELGWRPETSFEQGIKKTIDWYFENKEWMQ
ncbi:MAG: dTDP-glucose 4,6-dehydratase [Clostridiales bacterium]|nr:dTDP-glucose 4,6-dehydratase [Clostridiales bacterium]